MKFRSLCLSVSSLLLISGMLAACGSAKDGQLGEAADLSSAGSAQTSFQQIVEKAAAMTRGSTVGAAAQILPSGSVLTYNADHSFNSASSAKWLHAAAAAKRISVSQLAEHAEPLFRLSSNEDAGALIDHAGGIDAVNAYKRSLGISDDAWFVCKWNYGGSRHSSESCSGNRFTPRAALQFLGKVASGTLGLEASKAKELARWASLVGRPNDPVNLPLALGASGVMYKAGWIPGDGLNSLNEIAIVPLSDGKQLLVVISFENRENDSNAAYESEVTAMKKLAADIAKLARGL